MGAPWAIRRDVPSCAGKTYAECVMSRNPKYRRVVLKLSGQALMGEKAYGFDSGTVERIAT